jgi:hypothetical protein
MKAALKVVKVENFYDVASGNRSSRVILESTAKSLTAIGPKPETRVEITVKGNTGIDMTRIKDYVITLVSNEDLLKAEAEVKAEPKANNGPANFLDGGEIIPLNGGVSISSEQLRGL